jgi:molybdate transport system substrate-binding protein
MTKIIAILGILVLAAAAIFAGGCLNQQTTATDLQGSQGISSDVPGPQHLLVYCGAGLKDPMEEIAQVYEEKSGTKIEYTYGNSAQLLSQIELLQTGDAYMPGARPYIQTAIDKGYVNSSADVVYHVLAIAVPNGNPANISSVEDLARPGVRVAIGEPSGPAIGKATQKLLQADGLWDSVRPNIVVKTATVNELVVYLEMGQADAAIIWEDLYNPDTMDLVDIPEDQGVVDIVPIGSLTFSINHVEAENFVHFVASDESKAIFTRHGFTIYPSSKYGDS